MAEPSALILYSTLAKGPVLPFEDQLNSSRHFQRELNRLGVTSAIDAGGGGQNYPDDYKDIPFDGLRFIIDHAETIRPVSIDRIKALGGGIAIQHRMAFQGEYFVERYGATEVQFTPPVTDMLAAGVPVGAGTDATRVASFNPWVSLFWLVTGKTLGGLPLYPEDRQLDREQALSLWTRGSAWFCGEQDVKGTIAVGQYADLAVLTSNYFSILAEDIKDLTSVLTMVGGEIVHGASSFSDLALPLPPASPDWSPVRTYLKAHWEVISVNIRFVACTKSILQTILASVILSKVR